jgi:DHA2 family multidrug resistance protein
VSGIPVSALEGGEGMVPASVVTAPPSPPPPPASPVQLTGGKLMLVGLVLSFANFMVVLDTTIANVSVPNIAGGLGVSSNEGTWVITSYAVAEAITVPLTGWLAQRFGSVKTFVVAMVMFGLFSALCGLAPSLGVLVVFRVLQGLAGGPMIPLSQTLLLRVFPPEKAGQAMGMWAMTTVVAPIAGPILGGTICDNYNWPWVFYINVPFAFICAYMAWRFLANRETPTRRAPIDFIGLGLLVLWVGALQIMLDKGEDADWFQSSFIVAMAIIAGIGFLAFVIWELTDANPVVDLRVFSSRGYTIALIVLCLCFGGYFAAVVIVPLWLQSNLGYTATWAGYAVAPSGVFAVVMSPIVARLMGKVDSRLLIFFGVMGLASTMFWRAGFTSGVSFGDLVLPQFVQGFFVPFFFVPLFGLALGALKPADIASGAGLLSFARTMTGAFATSLATTFWLDNTRANRVGLLNQMDTAHAMSAVGRLGLSHAASLREIEALVESQSVMLATDKLFQIFAVLMVLSACSIWLTPKPVSKVAAGAAH